MAVISGGRSPQIGFLVGPDAKRHGATAVAKLVEVDVLGAAVLGHKAHGGKQRYLVGGPFVAEGLRALDTDAQALDGLLKSRFTHAPTTPQPDGNEGYLSLDSCQDQIRPYTGVEWGMAKKDLVTLGPGIDGKHPYLRERPDGRMQTGILGPKLAEGQPITDALLLKHEEGPVFEVLHEHRSSQGPPQVATDAYRDGWDGIFGNKVVGEA